MDLVFANNNINKIKEIEAVLSCSYHIKKLIDIGCNDELPETHLTIEENSMEKAMYIAENYKTNCFSEDSGLEIDALDGKPGVDSAHYSGSRDADKNMEKVLLELQNMEHRAARFKTVITLVINGTIQQFTGIIEGVIAYEKKGKYGFGYDPIFVLNDGRTMAELFIEEKSKISHRAIATRKLIDFLNNNSLS